MANTLGEGDTLGEGEHAGKGEHKVRPYDALAHPARVHIAYVRPAQY